MLVRWFTKLAARELEKYPQQSALTSFGVAPVQVQRIANGFLLISHGMQSNSVVYCSTVAEIGEQLTSMYARESIGVAAQQLSLSCQTTKANII